MWSIFLLATLVATARCKQLPHTKVPPTTTEVLPTEDTTEWSAVAPLDKLSVACERDSMHITVSLPHTFEENSVYDTFNGIVYPAGLGSNSSCLREYEGATGELQYTLPLMGCNTMATDNDDGTVEYFNNIIVQPHPKIVTGQGRGYHVRCRYRRRDLLQFHTLRQGGSRQGKALSDDDEDSDLQDLEKEFVMLPSVSMQLFKGDPEDKHEVSEAKVGDTVTLVVSLEKQNNVGMLVRDCYVHDALGWAEHKLIDEDGCPLDSAVMGMFSYSDDGTRAQVSFSAHKFAWSPSVYYTCGVKLCKKQCIRKSCSDKNRPKRDLNEGSPATVEVFTGLYVNEADSLESDEVVSEKKEDEICISSHNFAIGICIAGVILMACVIAAIACILARRRSPKSYSRTGSSLYSGPYTNTGYSHTS